MTSSKWLLIDFAYHFLPTPRPSAAHATLKACAALHDPHMEVCAPRRALARSRAHQNPWSTPPQFPCSLRSNPWGPGGLYFTAYGGNRFWSPHRGEARRGSPETTNGVGMGPSPVEKRVDSTTSPTTSAT